MESENPIALIFGERLIVTEIPYETGEEGIKQFEGIPEYYCALKSNVVINLSPGETVMLRNDLEKILSAATNKEMELGFAEFAETKNGKIVVLCYFKERGVPQCQQLKSNTDGKTML
jgi:hypothetical protein